MGKSRTLLKQIALQYQVLQDAQAQEERKGASSDAPPSIIGCHRADGTQMVAAFEEESGAADDRGTEESTVDSVLEIIGFGRFQVFVMALCGFGWLADAAEVVGLSYVFVDIDKEWGTTTADWGLLGSMTSVSAVMGAFCFGMSSDRFGRRPAFVLALLFTSAAGAASAAAGNFHTLLLLRILSSFGTGGCLPVAISLCLEHLPPSQRDSCLVLMQVFFAMGAMFTVALSWALPREPGCWRLFVLALSAPSALLVLLSRCIPESPMYLYQSGRLKQAQEALYKISASNHTDMDIVRRVTAQLSLHGKAGSNSDTVGVARLFTRDFAMRIILCCVLWACCAAGSDFWFWITEIGHAHGVSRHEVEAIMLTCRFVGVCAFFTAAASSRGGRGSQVLRAALAACSIASVAIAVLSTSGASPIVLACSVLTLAFPYDMVWGLLYATTASSFDAACRASALSVASACSRASAALTPLASGLFLESREPVAFVLWASSWAAAAVIAMTLSLPSHVHGVAGGPKNSVTSPEAF